MSFDICSGIRLEKVTLKGFTIVFIVFISQMDTCDNHWLIKKLGDMNEKKIYAHCRNLESHCPSQFNCLRWYRILQKCLQKVGIQYLEIQREICKMYLIIRHTMSHFEHCSHVIVLFENSMWEDLTLSNSRDNEISRHWNLFHNLLLHWFNEFDLSVSYWGNITVLSPAYLSVFWWILL